MDLHNIREEYRKRVLSQHDCHKDPISQFELWMNEAITSQVNEPTAMNVATVDENGKPSSRMVLLKEVNQQGFVFFTNYHSKKGLAIEHNPYVALTFFWPELERQVRIEGKAVKISDKQSDEYFASRPYTSRIGAWASKQSAVISGYKSLLAKAALVAAKYPINVPRPAHWGGYLITPNCVEFWQGRPSRLHDRIQYRLENNIWIRERLSP
ncbi:pyridoxamine 5'-phosphate oxidase [Rodentibacter pneumotropicus]|uniref:Pyridoxine/pyridoxamine 5'-phosphate oxidase n=1 Tax=Rodentibacter pneumotropicus TaxID=758 RepID=A0A3S4TXT5_9PAST|nr:pyridoxamine 5'-phosphate oxidase [Rodentibacter pneumotropicus]NBH75907.1 pyridoxamine 5'-phosphate oxidase [Rodentibacter pneumotropicus]OOF62288.1 pyridoxamine 5'-phosphate oxidase [Rodentibacter pneumotropicus]TGZ99353.1 pyridoxamine 5'-phosphate oxidase [Rodentibacter pneumotropicus]THA03359.1 pyridoxamine 5'-phosphate oxidase [Rodentibacter pneumotropicus]THA04628.1 pyridoxamine 5'-phosphate oxidase [Rodentibacter pneumotropicus]